MGGRLEPEAVMKQLMRAAAAVMMGVAVLVTTGLSAGAFDKADYAARRSRLMEQIGDSAAVFLGAPTPSSDHAFRQGHDFFYLTGVEIPDAFLVVDGMRKESVLFFTMSEAAADGEAIPLELVRTPADYTGIERVLPADQFSAGARSTRCSSRKNWAARTATRSSTRCRSR